MFHRSDKFLLEMVENNKIISTLTIKVKLREKKNTSNNNSNNNKTTIIKLV